MYAAWFIFFLLWVVYAWVWKETHFTNSKDLDIKIDAPLLKRNCSEKEVPCIDDCSFLCFEKNTECVGGICETKKSLQPCNEQTGGMRIMIHEPVSQWSCICTDSRFYGGPACDQLNPDVCEHGSFHYFSRTKFSCICPLPYKLLKIGSIPHCIEERMMGFYDPLSMNQSTL